MNAPANIKMNEEELIKGNELPIRRRHNARRRKAKYVYELQDCVPDETKVNKIVSKSLTLSESDANAPVNTSSKIKKNCTVGSHLTANNISRTFDEDNNPSTSTKSKVNSPEIVRDKSISPVNLSSEWTYYKIKPVLESNEKNLIQSLLINSSNENIKNYHGTNSIPNHGGYFIKLDPSEMEKEFFASNMKKGVIRIENEYENPSDSENNQVISKELGSEQFNKNDASYSAYVEEISKMKNNNLRSGTFHGKGRIFFNSSFKSKVEKETRHCVDKGTKKEEATTSKSEKKCNKNSWVDTKFPKYLTSDEIENISKFGILLSGFIRINQKNFKEAYISAPDKGMDILIQGLIDRNRALEGDEVFYVLKNENNFRGSADNGEVQRTAVVVALKKIHHSRSAIGTLKVPDKNQIFAVFSPRDSRIPRIRIAKNSWPTGFPDDPDSFENKLFYAKIKNWDDVRYAEGEITKEIGYVGDIDAETSAILLMCELDVTPYSDSFRAYFPEIPYKISNKDWEMRKDFREECIFTIDPASAKDLDDAVSSKLLKNGNYEIGVHISDVTHFLQECTPLNDAVCERATTIYLVQKVYHMLPRELCELCSLTPGEEKLSFSVLWEITPDGDIVNHHFARSVINSCGKFSYEQVQDILDGKKDVAMPRIYGSHSAAEIFDSINRLNKIAVQLRKKRFDNGALRIDQTKITFSLDEHGMPLDYSIYVNKEAHRLIEEFMLLANITVAEKISSFFPKMAFLRSHQPPAPYMLAKLQKHLMKYGINLDITSSKSLNSSLLKFNGSDDQSVARLLVINSLLAKPMTRATYYCSYFHEKDEDRTHYALNVPLYTHFTSPIRRYADVVVHRLLAAALGYQPSLQISPDEIQMIAENCNNKKYAAKLAGEKSTELFLTVYILERLPMVCKAVICDIKDKSFDCIVLENGFHQRIYYKNILGETTVSSENGVFTVTVVWRSEDQEDQKQVLQLFSIVTIKMEKCSEPNNIKTILLPN